MTLSATTPHAVDFRVGEPSYRQPQRRQLTPLPDPFPGPNCCFGAHFVTLVGNPPALVKPSPCTAKTAPEKALESKSASDAEINRTVRWRDHHVAPSRYTSDVAYILLKHGVASPQTMGVAGAQTSLSERRHPGGSEGKIERADAAPPKIQMSPQARSLGCLADRRQWRKHDRNIARILQPLSADPSSVAWHIG